MDVTQMNQVMGTSQSQQTTQKGMSVEDMMTIANGGTVNHQQAAAALGHSTNMLMDIMKGVGKGALNDIQGIHDMGKMVEAPINMLLGDDKGEQALNEKMTQLGTSENSDQTFGKGIETGMTLGLGAFSDTGKAVKEGVAVKTGIRDMMASRYTSRVASDATTMTKGERLAAVEQGRKVPTRFGGSKYLPSDSEERAAKILKGKTYGNSLKNVPVVQKEIASRGQEAEQFLAQKGRPVDPTELEERFAANREEAAKVLNESQLKDYDQTLHQFTNEWESVLRDKSGASIGTRDTGTLYKGLKNFETNVTARLPKGKEALLTDSGSAKLEAAKQVRHTIRDLIGDKVPEFKDKMFDLSSLYDALDNVVAKGEAQGLESTPKKILKKSVVWGAEAVGAGALYEGAKSAGIPLP